MAVDSRSQLSSSRASCFRPAARQRVELRLAAGIVMTGLRLQPALLLEAMERRVERALRDLQHLAAHLLDALGDRPAVLGLERDGLENQQIERALNSRTVCSRGSYADMPKSSTMIPRLSTIRVRRFRVQVRGFRFALGVGGLARSGSRWF